MKYNELIVSRTKQPSRVGRGIAAGKGKTAGRGTKGQGSRKSGGVRPGFEGGQMPLYMRLPKLRGFKSPRQPAKNVFTAQLDGLKGVKVDNFTLYEAGLITSPYVKVKMLFNGDLKSKKEIKLQAASRAAVEAVQKAGGSFSVIERIGRTAKVEKVKKVKNTPSTSP